MDDKTRERLAHLADPARVHAELARDSIAARDSYIADCYEAGDTIRELAEGTGLSRSQVHRIVLREAAKRQIITVEE